MREEPIYDSISEVVEDVENGEINPKNIRIIVDNDYTQAFIDDLSNFDDDYPEAIVDDEFVDMQILAKDEQLPRGTLKDVLSIFNFDVSGP